MIAESFATQSTASEASGNGDVVLRTQPPLRTLDDVRLQVAHEVAVRAITKSQILDGVRVGISLSLSQSEDDSFLHKVADVIAHQLALGDYLFALATTLPSAGATPLVICSSSPSFLHRAILLTSSKFLGRILRSDDASNPHRWAALVQGLGSSSYDDDALRDALHKATLAPIDPLLPPPGSRSIAQILADTRAKLQRITPEQAYDELREPEVGAPTFLVDIRPEAQRERMGGILGSLVIERNVLEWRFDPRSEARLPIADRYDLRVIVFCQEGYTSSLAAYALQQLGLLNATDIIGGFQAWKDAGLPTDGQGLAGIEQARSMSFESSMVSTR
ncbi:hypothetical protein D9615_010269 [Tricholomella constricta]|uniref:Rhodanese domain-containing protein n=1 Tax=Tricholomella constricta TaxID=117010 RepID=A0A8H5GLV2_9AGAR|nr:hypothetical protein D9615_010269 [Tricholomella constricta]